MSIIVNNKKIAGAYKLDETIQDSNNGVKNSAIYNYTENNNDLETTNKSVVGAINELNNNFSLQYIYDLVHPVGEKVIAFSAPAVPTGVTATWVADTSYDGKAIWIDSTQAGGTELAGSLPNIEGKYRDQWIPFYWRDQNTGAFYKVDSTVGRNVGDPASGTSTKLWKEMWTNFKASESNSVYSAEAGANVVRPTSVTASVWKRTA